MLLDQLKDNPMMKHKLKDFFLEAFVVFGTEDPPGMTGCDLFFWKLYWHDRDYTNQIKRTQHCRWQGGSGSKMDGNESSKKKKRFNSSVNFVKVLGVTVANSGTEPDTSNWHDLWAQFGHDALICVLWKNEGSFVPLPRIIIFVLVKG